MAGTRCLNIIMVWTGQLICWSLVVCRNEGDLELYIYIVVHRLCTWWPCGLVVWFLLRVQEVPISIIGRARLFYFFYPHLLPYPHTFFIKTSTYHPELQHCQRPFLTHAYFQVSTCSESYAAYRRCGFLFQVGRESWIRLGCVDGSTRNEFKTFDCS